MHQILATPCRPDRARQELRSRCADPLKRVDTQLKTHGVSDSNKRTLSASVAHHLFVTRILKPFGFYLAAAMVELIAPLDHRTVQTKRLGFVLTRQRSGRR